MCTSGALVIATSSKRRKYRSATGQQLDVTPRSTAPVPLCSVSTYRSWPRNAIDVFGVEAGVVGAAAVAEGAALGADGVTVGSGSFTVVRMNSGDPRYQPSAMSRR